jgi:hypothetical protein
MDQLNEAALFEDATWVQPPLSGRVLLRGIDDGLRADFARPAGRGGARRTGGLRQTVGLIGEAGFGHVRKATETPFNMVIEARL